MTPVSTVTAACTLVGLLKVIWLLSFLDNAEYTRLYISVGNSNLSREIGAPVKSGPGATKSRYLTCRDGAVWTPRPLYPRQCRRQVIQERLHCLEDGNAGLHERW